MIRPVESGAYAYYDGISIKGISFVRDESLEKQFDHLVIPVEVAA